MIRAKRQVRQGDFENHGTLFLSYSSSQSVKGSPTRPLSLPAPRDLDGPALGLGVGEAALKKDPDADAALHHTRGC